MATPSTNIQRLKDEAKKAEKKHKELLARIRKAEQEAQLKRYISVGKGMERIFKHDPACGDAGKIAALCSKHFNDNNEKDVVIKNGAEIKSDADGVVVVGPNKND